MLRKNIIGIDISDYAIKVIQLDGHKTVVAYGVHELPPGVVVEGVIVDCDTFVMHCSRALRHTKPKSMQNDFQKAQAIVSLPEDKVWSHTVAIPDTVPPKEFEKYLYADAANVIPVDIEKLYTTYSISTIRDTQFATFVGAEKDVVAMYASCIQAAGLQVDFVGSYFYSIARAVLPKKFEEEDNYIIVDIGYRRTTVGVFDENAIAYVATQNKVSRKSLSAPSEAAATETLCHTVQDAVSCIVDDIHHIAAHFEKSTKQEVTKVVVVGQLEHLDDIVAGLQNVLTQEVTVGNPYMHIQNTDSIDLVKPAFSFANAIGLAMYGVDKTLPHINLLPKKKVSKEAFKKNIIEKITTLGGRQILYCLHILKNTTDGKTSPCPPKLLAVLALLLFGLFLLGYVFTVYLV